MSQQVKNQPIGVFDSGLGGLTVVKALQELMPDETYVYFGDTVHLPYGDKSPGVLRGYIEKITRFLVQQQVKAIVVACNTASSVAYDDVCRVAGVIPVFEVISPAVQEAVKRTAIKRIGVIGTVTTIQSHVYLVKILEKMPNAQVTEKATPALVALIEDGLGDSEAMPYVLKHYLSDNSLKTIDTLILGCTHYPLIKQQIKTHFEKNCPIQVHIADSSLATAESVKQYLEKSELLADPKAIPQTSIPQVEGEELADGVLQEPDPRRAEDKYYVSDLNDAFIITARRFFGPHINLQRFFLE